VSEHNSDADDKLLVLTFYVVADVSWSMTTVEETGETRLDAVNRILPSVIDAIDASNTLGDLVRFGAIDFAEDARVVLRLDDVRNVETVPTLTPRSSTSYAAAFRLLRKEIASDIAQLKSDGYKVFRPAVFFITDGEPTDPVDEMKAAFEELTDPDFRARPNLILFGVGEATKEQLDQWVYPKQGDGPKPMRSYVAKSGVDAATAIKQIAEMLVGSIVASANSVADAGDSGGFIPPDDEDLDDWV
jgi:uncharacterized protein YegL